MKFNVVYITTKNRTEAKKLARVLVKERLAACANIINKIESVYWWQGRMVESAEAAIIAKTRKSLVSKLIKKAKALHSYDCPCIVSWPLVDGNPDYLAWLKAETK